MPKVHQSLIKQVMRLVIGVLGILWISSLVIVAQSSSKAILLNVKSAIGPATQDYIEQGLKQAKEQNAPLVIIQLDTPGGLGKAMRAIISDIIASPIPVAVYVAPSGAHAASAGTFILYAAHIAAMAPGTNVGAATPVSMGAPTGIAPPATDKKEQQQKPMTDVESKMLNDAKAYIRSLAELRGRNVEWAEKAVITGASISSSEALKLHVIDIQAKDIPDLLAQMNGKKVVVQGQEKTLQTSGITVEQIRPGWRSQFLSVITDPSVAYLLLIIGMWGLFFEFVNPGFVLPGITGAICLLLALYAFQLLPINYVGLALILLGAGCMVAEAYVASFGVLGIGGIIAFIIGSILLLDRGTPGFEIAFPLILVISVVTAGFFLLVIHLAIRAHRKPIVAGREELLGSTGAVMVDSQGIARTRIHGELWQVKSKSPLTSGQKIKVTAV